MTNPGKRLTILSPIEIEELYEIPKFSAEQRELYFTLNDVENQEMESLRSLESRLYFILQLGYFKYKSMFFKFEFAQVKGDLDYILCRYFPAAKQPKKTVNLKTQLKNKSQILRILYFKRFNKIIKQRLEILSDQHITVRANPRYILKVSTIRKSYAKSIKNAPVISSISLQRKSSLSLKYLLRTSPTTLLWWITIPSINCRN